jgi:hypothetical protein
LDNALHVQGVTQDPRLVYLNFITKPLGQIDFDIQEAVRIIPGQYYNFLPLFLEEEFKKLILR